MRTRWSCRTLLTLRTSLSASMMVMGIRRGSLEKTLAALPDSSRQSHVLPHSPASAGQVYDITPVLGG